MKVSLVKSTVLGILSIQSLAATCAHAHEIPSSSNDTKSYDTAPATLNINRIIQKRLVGFDPKQAVETLTFLKQSGIQRFENDGSIQISAPMIQDIMEVAALDQIEVRILNYTNGKVTLKFAAHDPLKFDRSKLSEAIELAKTFELKCDMDGKEMF